MFFFLKREVSKYNFDQALGLGSSNMGVLYTVTPGGGNSCLCYAMYHLCAP